MKFTNNSEKIAYISNVLTVKGIRHDVRREDDAYQYVLGFTNGKGVWHWFTMSDFNKCGYLTFDHSYSQNVGKSKKGFSHSMVVRATLERLVGAEIIKAEPVEETEVAKSVADAPNVVEVVNGLAELKAELAKKTPIAVSVAEVVEQLKTATKIKLYKPNSALNGEYPIVKVTKKRIFWDTPVRQKGVPLPSLSLVAFASAVKVGIYTLL